MTDTAQLIDEARRYYQTGDFRNAAVSFKRLTEISPNDALLHYRLGVALANLGVITQAREGFERAISLQPTTAEFYCDLARTYLQEGRLDQARSTIDRALSVAPGHEAPVALSAELFNMAGDPMRAWEQIRPAIESGMPSLRLAITFAELCPDLDRIPDGVAAIEARIADPQIPPAMRRLALFRLGDLYDRLDQPDRAFACYDGANRHIASGFNPQTHTQSIQSVIQSWSADRLARAPRASQDAAEDSALPVLLVGMPRSGVGLVESILWAHPKVGVVGESGLIPQIITALTRPGDGQERRAEGLSQELLDQAARAYITSLRSVHGDAERITDRMMAGFANLGMLSLALPGARVVHCTRDPRDLCMAIFAQSLPPSVPYAHDITHIASFCTDYQRLMDHWKRVLAIPIHEVSYEALVREPEATIRDLLGFLGLDWDEACPRFHEPGRVPVSPATRHLLHPIDSTRVGRFERYAPFIQGALGILGAAQSEQAMAWEAVQEQWTPSEEPIAFSGPTAGAEQLLPSAEQAFGEGNFAEAARICADIDRGEPDNARVLRLLGAAQLRLGHRSDALGSLERALTIDPDDTRTRGELAMAHRQLGHFDEAQQELDRALGSDPEAEYLLAAKAELLSALGRSDEAYALLSPRAQAGSRDVMLINALAKASRWVGRESEALPLVEDLLGGNWPAPVRGELLFRAGELRDRLGRYDEAFEAFDEANRLVARPFDADAYTRQVDRLIGAWSPQAAAMIPTSGLDTRLPLFIVGMPRTGTTLVEQILACHGGVCAGGERTDIERAAFESQKGRFEVVPLVIDTSALTVQFLRTTGERINADWSMLAGDAERFTDKTPVNSRHLGLIGRLFPGARVVHCTRDPMDTCLSCYFEQLTLPFASSLSALGEVHRADSRLMDHWKRTLDLPILELNYERLVSDQEAQTRRLIDFAGLDWDDACLHPEASTRIVATASFEQVRRPVTASSVGRYRNYEKHLGELEAALAGSAPNPAR